MRINDFWTLIPKWDIYINPHNPWWGNIAVYVYFSEKIYEQEVEKECYEIPPSRHAMAFTIMYAQQQENPAQNWTIQH